MHRRTNSKRELYTVHTIDEWLSTNFVYMYDDDHSNNNISHNKNSNIYYKMNNIFNSNNKRKNNNKKRSRKKRIKEKQILFNVFIYLYIAKMLFNYLFQKLFFIVSIIFL